MARTLLTGSSNYNTGTLGDFRNWTAFLSNAFFQFGWVRAKDSGQGVAMGTAIQAGAIVSVVGGGSSVVVTYNDQTRTGAAIAVGMQIQLVGVTVTTAYNGTYLVTAITGAGTTTATFTFASATTGSATVTSAVVVTNPLVAITHVTGNGTIAVYTYDDTVRTGSQLLPGMSITTAGCTTGGFNVTGPIQAVTGNGTTTATFTLLNTTNVTEAESGASGAVPAQNSTAGWSELWGTNDALSSTFQVYVKIGYTQTAYPNLSIQIGTGTNGSSTLTGTVSTAYSATGSTATATGCTLYACGDSGNMTFMLFTAGGIAGSSPIVNLERSLDNSGSPTASYYTYVCAQFNATSQNGGTAIMQSIMASGGITTQETGGLPASMPRTATTGNFGQGTLVGPVSPLVGLVGNPMTGVILCRGTDFFTWTQVQVTLYGTVYTYIVMNPNNPGSGATNLWNAQLSSGILVRFS